MGLQLKRSIIIALKFVVAIALLGLIFVIVKPASIIAAAKTAKFSLIVTGAILMPLNLFIQQYKWRYLVKLVKPDVSYTETIGSLLAGYSFGILTPGRIGEYSRALFIKDTKPLKLIGLTIIDKFYNLGMTIAVGLPALLTLPWMANTFPTYLFVALLILLAIGDLILLYFALDPRLARSLIYAIQINFPKQGKISQLLGGLDRFSAPQARRMLLYTSLYYLTFQAQYFLMISGFAGISLTSSIRAAAATLFTKSALPIAIGDLGLDQLASMTFFGQFGISDAAALNASIMMFAVNVLIPSLAGIPFASRFQLGKSKNKETT